MRTFRQGPRSTRWLLFLLLIAGLLTLPSAGAAERTVLPDRLLAHTSQAVATRYWLAHPDQAPLQFRDRFQQTRRAASLARAQAAPIAPSAVFGGGTVFNLDTLGLPQNEESVTACGAGTVLGGTNDYRGLLDPAGNFTGWHLSTDGGVTVRKEGRLPVIAFGGVNVPSGGDPVMASDAGCNLYAGSLSFDPVDSIPSGIGVYRTTAATLASAACTAGSSAPACWPTRRAVAVAAPGHFLDKEWIYVGRSGAAGTVVWTVYTDFGPLDATIKAVRCSANLATCTAPITLETASGTSFVQFGDVTIGPDGRTYITWTRGQDLGTPQAPNQVFTHKLRVAGAGSTAFGAVHTVASEPLPMPFGGKLHANDFRVATVPKSEVRTVNGKPRVFVVWEGCRARPLNTICEEPAIRLRRSDNLGVTWSATQTLSVGGDNYFPTISNDKSGTRIAVAWYTNRFDSSHNRQDVEFATVNPVTGLVAKRQRVTTRSNPSEADPLLGGAFIGDYFEVFVRSGTAYIHYNANHRQIRLLNGGFPIPQQDNYLAKRIL